MYKIVSLADHRHDLYYDNCLVKTFTSLDAAQNALQTIGVETLKRVKSRRPLKKRGPKPKI